MTTFTTNVKATGHHHPAGRLSLWRWLKAALAARHQRLELSQLSPHMLDDIGVSRDEAEREARRSMWDVPEHWLR